MLAPWLLALTIAGAPVDEDANAHHLPDALDVAATVLGEGCKPRLLQKKSHAFFEAQIACDGFLSFRLVDEVLDGKERAPRVEVLHRLLDDGLLRGRAPFERLVGSEELAGKKIPNSVLYRGYVLLMLSGLARIEALTDDESALYDALAADLVEDYAKKELLVSFGKGVWPCDNALAASGLVLHGRLRQNPSSTSAGLALAARLEALRKREGGFPTKLAPDAQKTPRGTVLAWTTSFLAVGGLAEAEGFASDFVDTFCQRPLGTGPAACREWPKGRRQKADAVSGPITGGYAVGATALGLVATHAVGKHLDWNRDLWSTARLGGLGGVVKSPARFPLENAILLWSDSVRAW